MYKIADCIKEMRDGVSEAVSASLESSFLAKMTPTGGKF